MRPRVVPSASTRPPEAWSDSIRPIPASTHQDRWQEGSAAASRASAFLYAARTVTGMPVDPSVTTTPWLARTVDVAACTAAVSTTSPVGGPAAPSTAGGGVRASMVTVVDGGATAVGRARVRVTEGSAGASLRAATMPAGRLAPASAAAAWRSEASRAGWARGNTAAPAAAARTTGTRTEPSSLARLTGGRPGRTGSGKPSGPCGACGPWGRCGRGVAPPIRTNLTLRTCVPLPCSAPPVVEVRRSGHHPDTGPRLADERRRQRPPPRMPTVGASRTIPLDSSTVRPNAGGRSRLRQPVTDRTNAGPVAWRPCPRTRASSR